MNGLLQAILLGVVQGLTEFLPVSSSGHLVLAQAAFGEEFSFAEQAVVFDLVLHVGTLLPVLFFYRAELLRMLRAVGSDLGQLRRTGLFAWLRADVDRHFAWLVVLGTLPTGIIGVLFKDVFEGLFHNVAAVCLALFLTGGLLLATRRAGADGRARTEMGPRIALVIGLVQGLAITPGISRSGSTIAVGLLLGLDRETAARFSFLLSIPAICGAVVLVMKDGVTLGDSAPAQLAAGFASAMVVGYLALVMLVALVKRGGLHRFTYYLWPAALLAFLWLA